MFRDAVIMNATPYHNQYNNNSNEDMIEVAARADDSCVSSLTAGTRRRNVSSMIGSTAESAQQHQQQLHMDSLIDHHHQHNNNNTAPTKPKHNNNNNNNTLYGRTVELDRLLNAYQRVSDGPSEVVLLHGPLGCGKTSLAEALRAPVVRRGGYYVTGKFEHIASNNTIIPYPALVEALTDLCDLIAQSKGFGESQQARLLDHIGTTHAQRLSALLGNLHRITGQEEDALLYNNNGGGDDNASIASTSTQRHYMLQWSLQKFLRACATAKHPLCIVLDDVQWADAQSVQLLQALMTMNNNQQNEDAAISKHVLFVMVYRDVVVDNNTASSNNNYSDLFYFPKNSNGSSSTRVSDIRVPNLGLEAMNRWMASRLGMDTASVLPLAEVVLRKTHGHAYCVLEFIQQLQASGLLTYNATEELWDWNLLRIQSETNVTANVASLVMRKVQSTHKYVQLILKVASAIGFEFDRQLLEQVIIVECNKAITTTAAAASTAAVNDASNNNNNNNNNTSPTNNTTSTKMKQKIHKYLAMALRENLIEKTGSAGRYKFTHTRVQEAVYQQIPKGAERNDLHIRVGDCIRVMLYEEEQEWMIFGAAEQYNRAGGLGQWTDPQQRLELLRINLRAAKLAQARGAFLPAHEFCANALQLAPQGDHMFSSNSNTASSSAHYELGLELYSLAADIDYAVGDFEGCERNAKLIFSHAKCTNDKMGPFRALMDAMDAQGRGEEAVEVALELLQEYGEKFPRKPKAVNVIMELVKTQKSVMAKSDAQLIHLPEITDTRKLNVLKLISVFGTLTPLAGGNELISLLSTLRVVQRSLRDGVAPISSHAYASFGMAMAMIGHQHEAFRFGNVAVEMLKRFETPANIQAHTLAVVHGACRHWKAPLRVSLQPLMQAYEEGMVAGDIKFSFLAVSNYLVGCFESGVSLHQVEVDMRTFCEGLDEMLSNNNHSAFRTMIIPIWQQVLCLMGKNGTNDNPLRMVGTAMDEHKYILNSTNTAGMLVYSRAKLALAYHFENLRLAEQLIEELEKDEKMICWHFSIYQLLMYFGLTSLHLAEQTGKRKYRVKATRIIKKLEGWMQDGNPNCLPYVKLLRAELAASATSSSSRGTTASDAFHDAILQASRAGLPHIQALGYERAAMACFRQEDFREGARYIVQSRDCYEQWGAQAKVTYLERKFHMFFNSNAIMQHSQQQQQQQQQQNPLKEAVSIDSIDVPQSPATSNTTKSR